VRARLEDNDSHRVFAGLGDLVVTGPTNTNLLDLYVLLVG
jgi:hydroxypyruvate reductase